MTIYRLNPLQVADVVIVFIAVLPVNDVRVTLTARVWLSKLAQYNWSNIYADAIGVLAQDKSSGIIIQYFQWPASSTVGASAANILSVA